jgi:clan AA aspartic protease (TIGR02281 family)
MGALLLSLLVLSSVAQPQAQPASPPRVASHPMEQARRLGVTEETGRPGVTEQPRSAEAEPAPMTRHPLAPGERAPAIIVKALVNQRVTIPLLLDTGATYTVLTRQTAQALGITDLARLPTQRFLTGNGPILWPVTTLQSVRIGTAEARAVEVAIDVEGHLPLGLLGRSFLHHFKVTVDHAQGQVTFERR